MFYLKPAKLDYFKSYFWFMLAFHWPYFYTLVALKF